MDGDAVKTTCGLANGYARDRRADARKRIHRPAPIGGVRGLACVAFATPGADDGLSVAVWGGLGIALFGPSDSKGVSVEVKILPMKMLTN